MSTEQTTPVDPAQQARQAEAIVAAGTDVRQKIAAFVTDTVRKYHLDSEGLAKLARSVMEGASTAVERVVPRDPDNTLRQVVDGLGDGLSAAALACRLAVEEAYAQGKTFATEDLVHMRDNLNAVRASFVDTVSAAAGQVRTLAAAQAASLRVHAEHTRDRMMPAVESALKAAVANPLQFGKETAAAGLVASQQMLGALFTAVGRRLQDVGQRLGGDGPAT